MNTAKWVALVLILSGALALAYGGFTYTKESHEANIGPLKLSVKDTETVNIPVWLGALSLVVGVIVLVVPSKR